MNIRNHQRRTTSVNPSSKTARHFSFENLEGRTLFDATSVSFGDGLARSVSFIDSDGTAVVVSLRAGTGTLGLSGESLVQTPVGHRVNVSGTNVSLDQIVVNSMVGARLQVGAKGGDGTVRLGDVTVNGTLASLAAKTTDLTGTLSSTGEMFQVALGSVTNGEINDGGALPTLALSVTGAVSDSSLHAAGFVRIIKAGSWSDSSGGLSSIDALGAGKIVVMGDFNADLTLTGSGMALGVIKTGSIGIDRWTITGDVGKIVSGASVIDWTAYVSGNLTSLQIQKLSGEVTAGSISKVRATSIAGYLETVRPYDGGVGIGALTAAQVTGSYIRSTNSIGNVRAGNVMSTVFSAGVDSRDGATQHSDFIHPTNIANFKSSSFSDSSLVSETLGHVNLGAINDVPPRFAGYGVSAEAITAFAGTLAGHAFSVHGLGSNTYVPDLLSAKHVSFAHFSLNVIGSLTSAPVGNGSDPGNDLARMQRGVNDLTSAGTLYSQTPGNGAPANPQAFLNVYGATIYGYFVDAVRMKNLIHAQQPKFTVQIFLDRERPMIVSALNDGARAMLDSLGGPNSWTDQYNALAAKFNALN